MNRLPAVVAAALLLGAVPARAGVIWQETFAPDPSGQTTVQIGVEFPLAEPTTKALLTITGGTLADAGWEATPFYTILTWWELPPGSGDWILYADTIPAGVGTETIRTQPAYSSYRYDTDGYDTCYGAGYHSLAVCGAVFAYGTADISGALVNADRPFTLTLSTGVPEPAAWAAMLAGFAGVGLALRRRRAARNASHRRPGATP